MKKIVKLLEIREMQSGCELLSYNFNPRNKQTNKQTNKQSNLLALIFHVTKGVV